MGNDIEIIKKHLSPPVKLVLKKEDGGEDIIYLKKLNVAQQIQVSNVSKKLQKIKSLVDSGKEVDDETNNQITIEMVDLFKSVLARSMPEIDDETNEQFVLEHFIELNEILDKLIPQSKDKAHAELIKKKMEENAKQINKSTE